MNKGVALVIRVDRNIVVNEISYICPRLISASIDIYGCKTKIISVYAPTEPGTDNAKTVFYRELCKHTKTEKHRKLIVLGDFNATTNAVKVHACIRPSSDLTEIDSNVNGERMLNFARDQDLSIMNTWFKHPEHHQITWYSHDIHNTKKTLDYLLCCNWLRQYCCDCRVRTSYDFNSDHKLLVTTFRTPKTKSARFRKRTAIKKRKLDLKFFMTDEELQREFIRTVNNNFENLQVDNSVDEKHADIVRILNETSRAKIPTKNPSKNETPWRNDPELDDLLKQRDEARRTNASKLTIRTLTRRILNRHKVLKNEFFKAEADKINYYAINRQIAKLFARAKSQQSTLKKPASSCPSEKLVEHFSNHFNPPLPKIEETPPELTTTIPEFVNDLQEISRQNPFCNDVPNREEIIKALSQLKNEKASNDIPPEILKCCRLSENFMNFFMELIEQVWKEKSVPTNWGNGRVEALWKGKGSKLDPAMYRGLNIGSTVAKVVINIILNRLQTWYNCQLTDNQYGFRQNRGTNDATFVTKRFQQISNDQCLTGFLLFVDLSAAFDHIARDWLWKSIRLRLPPELEDTTLIDILQNLYSKTSIDIEGSNVPTTAGVRQGGPESPPLFNLYIDFVMRTFMTQANEYGFDFFKFKYRIPSTRTGRREKRGNDFGISTLDWAGYADDIVLYLMSLTSLQASLPLIDSIFKRFKLAVNPKKTETMTTNRKYTYSDEETYPETVISLDGKLIKNTKNFCYLGSQICHDQNTTGDWDSRIEAARNKFSSMSNLLLNHHVFLETRIVFLRAYVRSRLVFNCANWVITVEQSRKIDSTWCYFLRKMVRGGFRQQDPNDEENFRLYYTNNEIHGICKTENVSNFLHIQQRKYASHLVRSRTCMTKMLLFQEDKCKKRGRNTNTLLKQVLANTGLSNIELSSNRAF